MIELKTPPHDIELEKDILSMMFIPGADEQLYSLCKPVYFYRSTHRKIFEKGLAIYQDHRNVDLSTFHLEFDDIDEVGGLMEIVEIAGRVYTNANMRSRIRKLMEMHHDRLVIAAGLSGNYETVKSAVDDIEKDRAAFSGELSIVKANDFREQMIEYYEKGNDPGESSGYDNFDKFLTFSKGQYTIITGAPSMGKSEFADALMVNLARYSRWNFAVCSFENYPVTRHGKKLVQKYSRFPFFSGYHQRLSHQDLLLSVDWVNTHFTFIEENRDRSFQNILRQFSAICESKKIDAILIDPWNNMLHNVPPGVKETDYIANCNIIMKTFALKHNVHFFLVAHPTKLQKNEKGIYPPARMYDISGSAHWYNLVDNGISIYQPDRKNRPGFVIAYIQKVRFQDNGEQGECYFRWEKSTGTYTPIDEDNF